MSSSKTSETLAWRNKLLELLPTQGLGITAAELTELLKREHGCRIDLRSVQRCLQAFQETFGLVDDRSSKPFRWKWGLPKPYGLETPRTTEAFALVLLGAVLEQLMPSPIASEFRGKQAAAYARLGAAGAQRFKAWTARSRYVSPGLPTRTPTYSPDILMSVQEALVVGCQLLVQYTKPGQRRSSEQRLHPLGFVQRGNVSYLVATAFDFEKPVLYALHRMRSCRLLKEAAKVPEEFSLDQYLEEGNLQFGGGQRIVLEALVERDLAYYLEESALSEDQTLVPASGDRYRLRATVTDSWQLSFWILSQGAKIEVLKPVALREGIADQLGEAVRNYRAKRWS